LGDVSKRLIQRAIDEIGQYPLSLVPSTSGFKLQRHNGRNKNARAFKVANWIYKHDTLHGNYHQAIVFDWHGKPLFETILFGESVKLKDIPHIISRLRGRQYGSQYIKALENAYYINNNESNNNSEETQTQRIIISI
jgi:hypothetical protein